MFYFGSEWLLKIKPSFFSKPIQKVALLKARIENCQGRTIFFGKLTPFIRGYIPVAAGMLQMDPYIFGKNISLTAFIWSGGWLTAGWYFFIA